MIYLIQRAQTSEVNNKLGASTLVLSIAAFWLGACPFSVWIGRWFLDKDIRHFGDGNPGCGNVFRAVLPDLFQTVQHGHQQFSAGKQAVADVTEEFLLN